MRSNRVGELGYDIHIASEHSATVYNKIMHIGTDFGLQDAGFRAFHSLSCEKGILPVKKHSIENFINLLLFNMQQAFINGGLIYDQMIHH